MVGIDLQRFIFADNYDLSLKSRGKVMELSRAVKQFVRPGMALHFSMHHTRPNAAIHEIARQFWEKDPGFTVLSLGLTNSNFVLVYGKLAKKVISTFNGDTYPAALPNPIYQEAYRNGTCEFESWTILSFSLRMRAGAMGMEWIPISSVFGSSMEEENKNDLCKVKLPDGREIGMARALRPDLTFIHGQAADPEGNVLMCPPYGEGIYGAMASRGGVIASVEQVVSPEFIRSHSSLVRIPSAVVKAVCPTELGAHPGGLSNYGLTEFPAYADDYEFMVDLRKVYQDPQALREWVEKWILTCPNQQEYLTRLGSNRVLYLKGRSNADSWVSDFREMGLGENPDVPSSSLEWMAVMAGRIIEEQVKKMDHHTILAGIGTSNLAAWLAAKSLKNAGNPVALIAEVGFYGYDPCPADPFIFNLRNIHTCRMLSQIDEVMGLFMGGANARCIGSLGAGQVDKLGNINTTKIPEQKLYLTGPGGGNDVASMAKEVVVSAPLGKRRYVDKLTYISSPGDRVTFVASDLAVFGKDQGKKELAMIGFPDWPAGIKEEDAIRRVKEACGFEVKAAPDLRRFSPPTREEIWRLRTFDPKKQFLS